MEKDNRSDEEEFWEILNQEVIDKCDGSASQIDLESAFMESVSERLEDCREAHDINIIWPRGFWKSQGRKASAQINAIAVSGDGMQLDLFISLYSNKKNVVKVHKEDVVRHFSLLRSFYRRAIAETLECDDENRSAKAAIHVIQENIERIFKLRLFLVTNGIIDGKSTSFEKEPVENIDVEYIIWDLVKLSRLKPGQSEPIIIDFSDKQIFGQKLACISAKAETDDKKHEYTTYITFIPAHSLAYIYGRYGQRLLESNVRAFLQEKNTVNRGLQKTLKDEPHRFLAYNNGLCCTASKIDIDLQENGMGFINKIHEFQIVNGGQTTASIYHATIRGAGKKGGRYEGVSVARALVQMKITVLENPEKTFEIVPLISKFANSQTKVTAADLAANGEYHRNIEILSRKIWAPARAGIERQSKWFYERAKGSYKDVLLKTKPGVERRIWEQMYPSKQKFTKTDLAKYENIWAGLPNIVCQAAEKNFISFARRCEDYGAPLVDEDYYQKLIARAIIYQESALILKEYKDIRAQVLAYTLSFIIEKTSRRINLKKVWDNQCISTELSNFIKYVGKMASEFLLRRSHGAVLQQVAIKNVTWQEFLESKILIPQSLILELSDTSYEIKTTMSDMLEGVWDSLRTNYICDGRTIGDLERFSGKVWDIPAKNLKRRRDMISTYACQDYKSLIVREKLTPYQIKQLIEMLQIDQSSINSIQKVP